ncbi:exodeoxyribonuclease VII small subunit [Patescibacteria group bacterium]|nr:exodeoxyribonuclease VII small subunit [Patescibacteria group bacterium]
MAASFSLQEAIKRLEEIEKYFQLPDIDLEEAISRHKEALKVAKEILEYLDKAENTIKEIDRSEFLNVSPSKSTEENNS